MIIAAFLLGIIYSVPLGPLGQIMLNRSVDKGFWHGYSLAIICAIADFIICEIFLIGTGNIILGPELKIALEIVGLILLFYFGVKELIFPVLKGQKVNTNISNNKDTPQNIKLTGKSLLKDFLLVTIYDISNPAIAAFWIGFSAIINQKFIYQHNWVNYFLFGLILFMGNLTCQYFSIIFAKKISKTISIKEIIKYISIPLYMATMSYFFYLVLHNILIYLKYGAIGL